jgi:hypothetical protein
MKTHIQDKRNGWHIAGALAACFVVGVGGLAVAGWLWLANWIEEFTGEREIV